MTDEIIGLCKYILAKDGAFSIGPVNVNQTFIIATAVLIGLTLILGYRFRTRRNKYKGDE